MLLQSIDATAAGLGEDGPRWRRVFGPPSAAFDALADDFFQPMLHLPKHPLRLAGFGLRAAMPATALARMFKTEQAKALFGGVAAHAFSPLNRPMSSAVGMALTCACHHAGWAVAKGGSGAITDALVRALESFGGRVETGVRVTSLAQLPPADALVFDLAPGGVADIAGDRLPDRVRRAYRRYRHGPGAFKLDLAVEGGVPWTNEACRKAGTVHVAGRFEEIVAGERDINRGRMPERPFVLVGQQYLADPSRSDPARDVHPVWTYAHVPSGYAGDATNAILAQLERFAPGVRERIVATAVRTPLEFERHNPNYVGGRHHHRREHAAADRLPAAPGARPLPLRRRALHLLRGDPARRGRSRDERPQRRAFGSQAPRRVKRGRPRGRPLVSSFSPSATCAGPSRGTRRGPWPCPCPCPRRRTSSGRT